MIPTLITSPTETYISNARRFALRLANTKIHDPGSIAYQAGIITFEELTYFCLHTEISTYFTAPQQNNSFGKNVANKTFELLGLMYHSTPQEASTWFYEITARTLNYYNYEHHTCRLI